MIKEKQPTNKQIIKYLLIILPFIQNLRLTTFFYMLPHNFIYIYIFILQN